VKDRVRTGRIPGMKTFAFLLLLSVLPALTEAREPRPTAKSILRTEGGAAAGTARLAQFPYQLHLKSAALRQDGGLRQLFRFTETKGYIGSGAEAHSAILRDFLRFWGDREFARVLRTESPQTRLAVIGALDYTWPYPGWTETEFPRTYRLARHETTEDY
jgi:hypothetical protein